MIRGIIVFFVIFVIRILDIELWWFFSEFNLREIIIDYIMEVKKLIKGKVVKMIWVGLNKLIVRYIIVVFVNRISIFWLFNIFSSVKLNKVLVVINF